LTTLLTALTETRRDDPDSHILVYFLADGENTDEREAEPFSQTASLVDGGAVLGYGTTEGGQMRASGGDTDGEYITDESGQPGVSRIDEEQLETIAGQMGVPYLHRDDPEAPIEGTMEGITLRSVPTEAPRAVAGSEDCYGTAAIPLAGLAILELAEMTCSVRRRLNRYVLRGVQ